MSMVILKYNLSDEKDKSEYADVQQAAQLRRAVEDILAYLREQDKYIETPDTIDKIRARVGEIVAENNVNLED